MTGEVVVEQLPTGQGERISVVMPVRNALPYLDESIRSILGQSFADFEFVILDDGSTDGSGEALRRWAGRDGRIRLFRKEASLGPVGSANFVVDQARHELVARMDADDISAPDRLRRQVELLRANPDAALVGCLWVGIDARGRTVRPRDRWRLAFPGVFAPFPHGSILFRRSLFRQAGGYRPESQYWEDADLYLRLSRLGRLLVIPDVLYRHRASALSTRLTSDEREVEQAVDRMYRRLDPQARRAPSPATGKFLPKVFVSIGSTRLWSGSRPGVLKRLLHRGQLRFEVQSIAVLGWAIWGALLPGSLRSFLRLVVRGRDFMVGGRFRDGEAYAWAPALPERLSFEPALDHEAALARQVSAG
jgi:glycosyltransferase involved in cell wall biosynthesis